MYLPEYFLIGLSLKAIDNLYERKRVLMSILAVLTAFMMGLMIISDKYSASIFLAIVLGSVLSKKVDNLAFAAGTILIAIMVVLGQVIVVVPLFLTLLLSAVLDEYGNTRVEKRLKKDTIFYWFRYRFSMKTCVFGTVLLNWLNPIYFIAFMIFEAGYHLGEWKFKK